MNAERAEHCDGRTLVQLTLQDRIEITSDAWQLDLRPKSACMAETRVRFAEEDIFEIQSNARLLAHARWPQLPFQPTDEQRKQFRRDQRNRSRLHFTPFRAPNWTGEPRPDAETVVLQSAACLKSYFGREIDWNDVSTYGTEHPPASRSGQGTVIADEALVSDFVRSHKTGKALLRYENGDEHVSQLCLILTYGKSIPDAIAALTVAGVEVTEAALTKQAQRLRRALEREEAQWSRRLMLKLADEAPEGTAEYLRKVAKRRVPTFKNLSEKR
jgi:hypothetical protein